MKNILLLCLKNFLLPVLSLFSISATAQDKPVQQQHEFNTGISTKMFNMSDAPYLSNPDMFVLHANYQYSLSKRFQLGFTIGANVHLNKNEIGVLGFCGSGDARYTIKKHKDYALAMAGIRYNWVSTHIVKLYSGLAGGLKYRNTLEREILVGNIDVSKDYDVSRTYNNIAAAYQLNLVGVRIGNRIGGFAELGIGDRGYATVGISCRF